MSKVTITPSVPFNTPETLLVDAKGKHVVFVTKVEAGVLLGSHLPFTAKIDGDDDIPVGSRIYVDDQLNVLDIVKVKPVANSQPSVNAGSIKHRLDSQA